MAGCVGWVRGKGRGVGVSGITSKKEDSKVYIKKFQYIPKEDTEEGGGWYY